MTDKQRIKLVRLLSKANDNTIKVLNRFDQTRNKLNPICYELEYKRGPERGKVYIGVVFGEILRFELDYELWDSAMRKGEPCPDVIRSAIDHYLVARAEVFSLAGMRENKILNARLELAELIKEIEND